MMIEKYFQDKSRIALAFSGGTDSAFLLSVAMKNGCDIRPYYVNTQFQSQHEMDDAKHFAEFIGAPLKILNFDLFNIPKIIQNDGDRCYHCKYAIFNLIKTAAHDDHCELVIDGTNASDDAKARPGMRALTELEVYSPLRECGLSKIQIRELSYQAGLATWNKPSNSCLATRIPTGMPIRKEALVKIERAENYLYELGFRDFRVKVFNDDAKIQLQKTQFNKACTLRIDILNKLSQYFDDVFLDFKCRD